MNTDEAAFAEATLKETPLMPKGIVDGPAHSYHDADFPALGPAEGNICVLSGGCNARF